MATFTTVAICNKSLVLCGASPITALSQDTANARALNAVYDISMQDFLTECKWNFSTTRSTLVTVASSVMAWLHTEEAYVYTRPSAALRIWEVSDSDAIWREEGGYIISDTADLGAKWAFEQTEVGLWQPKAIMAFIDKLCADISYQIINSVPKAEAFMTKYNKVSLPAAMSENAQTGLQQEVKDDNWLKSKFGNEGNPARSYS